jgi:hypothetical protein
MSDAPDDSPKTVTLLGSPPNSWMKRWIHSIAVRWSRNPSQLLLLGASLHRIVPTIVPYADIICSFIVLSDEVTRSETKESDAEATK